MTAAWIHHPADAYPEIRSSVGSSLPRPCHHKAPILTGWARRGQDWQLIGPGARAHPFQAFNRPGARAPPPQTSIRGACSATGHSRSLSGHAASSIANLNGPARRSHHYSSLKGPLLGLGYLHSPKFYQTRRNIGNGRRHTWTGSHKKRGLHAARARLHLKLTPKASARKNFSHHPRGHRISSLRPR
jgi:hypothetical protein